MPAVHDVEIVPAPELSSVGVTWPLVRMMFFQWESFPGLKSAY